MKFVGTADDDILHGTADADLFILNNGGADKALGFGGDDVFQFGAYSFSPDDRILGGGGDDTLRIGRIDISYFGSDSPGLVFEPTTIASIEHITFAAGRSYRLTTDDANIAAGRTLTVDASNLGAKHGLNFDGSAETDGHFYFIDSAGKDHLTGGAQSDTFVMSHTSVLGERVDAGGGDDMIIASAALTPDEVNGGDGNDTLLFNNDVTNPAVRVLFIEDVMFAAGHSYDVQLKMPNAATVDASALGAGDSLTFHYINYQGDAVHFIGGAGDDVLVGWGRGDVFDLSHGGDDHATGDGGRHITVGADTFQFGAAYTSADQITGGAGGGIMTVDGDYSADATLSTNVQSVQKIVFGAGHHYNFTDTTQHAFTLDAGALGSGDSLMFAGNGHYTFMSGGGSDDLTGGSLADTFSYDDGIVLSGATRDTIHAFDFANDIVKFATVNGIDATVTAGAVSSASFDTDLANLFGAGKTDELGAHHAVLFTADGGDLSGDTFLIVDGDGTAGYTSGSDLVIQLDGALHTGNIGTANFTG